MTANSVDVLESILKKLSILEEANHDLRHQLNQKLEVITKENEKRSNEIKELWERLNLEAITDDTSAGNRGEPINEEELEPMELPAQKIPNVREQPMANRRPTFIEQPGQVLIRAKEAIRTIETLRGRDDVGVEDFIKSVEFARQCCNEEQLLLKLILVEKITENAKRNIRYIDIKTYGELYARLRNSVSIPTTVVACRNRSNQTRTNRKCSII